MPNSETYNRVPSLVSPLIKGAFFAGYALLTCLVLAGLLGLFIYPDRWMYAMAIAAGAFSGFAILYLLDENRIQRCRFCRTPLGHVVRPLLLSDKYLSMQGTKKGDYFFTQCRWGTRPLTRRWAKISRRSAACHHCRLSEDRLSEHYQEASETDIAELNPVE